MSKSETTTKSGAGDGDVTFSTDTGAQGGGATVSTTYLERKQEFVAVNKTDLEDIIEFDNASLGFSGFGMFLVSGSGWLAVEKLLEQKDSVVMAPLLWVCIIAIFVGLFLLYWGYRMHGRKRNKITRIFSETRVVGNNVKST